MEKYVESLLTEIDQYITNLEKTEPNYTLFSKSAFEICETKKYQLKDFLVSYNFKTDYDEINFFKTIKPKIETKSIFYSQIFNIESKLPLFSKDHQIDYYKKQIGKALSFFRSKKEYYDYYKTSNNLLDQYYFLRKRINIQSFSKFASIDFTFSTGHDLYFNKICAFEDLIKYLEQRIFELEEEPFNKQKIPSTPLHWTANKVDLVELMYGLFASKAINNGDIEMSKLAEALQVFFNVELGDFYRTYSELKIRSNRVKFLEKIIDSLENKMENDL